MDRSFLSQAAVIEASRQFVCVRLLTYENEEEGIFLKSLFRTRSGELENTVFAVLAPDGKRVLVAAHRSARHEFSDAGELADSLNRVARPFTDRKERRERALPLVANVRLALNVAACDSRPLVVILAEEAPARKRLEGTLVELAWSDRFIGQFVYVAAASTKDLSAIRGLEPGSGVIVVEPGRYGVDGKVLAQAAASASRDQLARVLREAAAACRPQTKSYPAHIQDGREQKIFWETATPVTDPMERRARER
jgi:hypothetical protein